MLQSRDQQGPVPQQPRRAPSRSAKAVAPQPSPPTSHQRREALWEQIAQSRYDFLPALGGAPMGSARGAACAILRMRFDPNFREDVIFKPYTDAADVRPDRVKQFHSFGTSAKATFVPEANTPFTGIFASGAPALVRLSLAGNDKTFQAGASVKLFVEGQPSVNFLALHGLDGQTLDDGKTANRNFFALEPTTWFEPAVGAARILEGALQDLAKRKQIDPKKISLEPLAANTCDGAPVAKPVAPERITLRNPPHRFASKTPHDFRHEIARAYKPGDTLYEIWHDQTRLGILRLDSGFIASEFGDRRLAFNHQK